MGVAQSHPYTIFSFLDLLRGIFPHSIAGCEFMLSEKCIKLYI